MSIRGWMVGVGLAVVLLLLIMGLRASPTWLLRAGEHGDTRFLAGFFLPEHDGVTQFRWSGPKSSLRLHGAGTRPHVLRLRLYGDKRDPDGTTPVQLVAHDDQIITAFHLQPRSGWRDYHLLLPANTLTMPNGEAAPLALVYPTHRPGADDQRDLGIPLAIVERIPIMHPSVLISHEWLAIRGALLLMWPLVLGALLLWHTHRRTPNVRRDSVAIALFAIIGMALCSWAFSDPATFAWAIPPLTWAPALASLLIIPFILRASVPPRPHLISAALLGIVGAQILFITQHAWLVGIGVMLAGVAIVVLAHAPPFSEPSPHTDISWRTYAIFLLLIFIIALFLRLWHIDTLPYSLWRDEGRHGLVALRILEDATYRPIYEPRWGVDLPGFGFYPLALALWVFGIEVWSLRIATALAGALTVIPLAALMLSLFERRALALGAAALLAISSWHISISRFSFPTIFEPLLTLTGLWLLVVALRSTASRWRIALFVLAGLSLGLAFQTYHTGRLVPLLGFALLVLVPRQSGDSVASRLRYGALVAGGFLLVTMPLLIYAAERPEQFQQRVAAVSLVESAMRKARAPLAALDESLGLHMLMFHVSGDQNGRHHAPGAPMLDWITGLGMLVGIGLILRQSHDWRYRFLGVTLALTLIPSVLAVEGPHAMRSIGAVAIACMIAALGWEEVSRRIGRRWTPLLMLWIIALLLNMHTYFVSMATDRDVWGSSYPIHTQIGQEVRTIANEQGHEAVQRVWVSGSLFTNPVMSYLAHDLPVQPLSLSEGAPIPPPGSIVILSGYTYESDESKMERLWGRMPERIRDGPLLPGTEIPSFVVYQLAEE